MRSLPILGLLVTALIATATETPLVINALGGNMYGVIDPGTGAVTIYEVDGQNLNRFGSTNFRTDLEELRDKPYQEREGVVYSYLRVGSTSFLPMPSQVLEKFPNKPTATETAAGLESYQRRAVKAEDAFWKKPAAYDGVVRGAFSRSVLMLAIPSLHAVMVYEVQDRNRGPQLKAYRNYGPDLMIPQVMGSVPLPQDILDRLPKDIRDERLAALTEQIKKAGEKAGELTLAASDPYVVATSTDRFLMIDPANKHIVTYEWNGGNIKFVGSRNTEIDLMIPTAFNSNPAPQAAFEQFAVRYRKELANYQFPLDVDNLTVLATQTAPVSEKINKLQHTANANGDVIFNYMDLRKLFVYRVMGNGNNLEMVSMRDYTVDVGLAILADKFNNLTRGTRALQETSALSGKGQNDTAMLSLRYALKVAPSLVAQVEKDSRLKVLQKHADWATLIAEAKTKAQEEETQRQERMRLVEELKKKKRG